MNAITFENQENPNRCGQRHHKVLLNGNYIGTLYDNRDSEEQRAAQDTFVFLPGNIPNIIGGRLLPYETETVSKEQRDYLSFARTVRDSDRAQAERKISAWIEDLQAFVEDRRQELRDVLDYLPELPFTVRDGVTKFQCLALGPAGSFPVDLSASDVAKAYGHSFEECRRFQIIEIGVGRRWGMGWFYRRGESQIHVGADGYRVLSVQRSAAHLEYDKSDY